MLLRPIQSYSIFGAIHDLPRCTACCFLPHPRVHPLDEQQAASVTASHNPGHGTKGDIKSCESRLRASISPRLPTLDGRPRRPYFPILAVVDPIWIVATPSDMEIFGSQVHGSLRWTPGESHMKWRIRSLSRRGDIPLGIPPILAHFEQPKRPPFGTPISPPPCGQLAAPYLYAHE